MLWKGRLPRRGRSWLRQDQPLVRPPAKPAARGLACGLGGCVPRNRSGLGL